MRLNRKYVAVGAAIGALAAGGVGIAYAVGGDSEEQATGPDADRAKQAAVDAVGGGRAVGAEREGGAWEVEVVRSDGSQVEVQLGSNFKQTGVEGDDDGSQDRDEGGRDDD
jgi:hypothetical protein